MEIICLIDKREYTKEEIIQLEKDLAEINFLNRVCELTSEIISTKLSGEQVGDVNVYCQALVVQKYVLGI